MARASPNIVYGRNPNQKTLKMGSPHNNGEVGIMLDQVRYTIRKFKSLTLENIARYGSATSLAVTPAVLESTQVLLQKAVAKGYLRFIPGMDDNPGRYEFTEKGNATAYKGNFVVRPHEY